MIPKSTLESARDLLAAGWVQFASAANKHLAPVAISDPEACAFCAVGAIRKAAEMDGIDDDNMWETISAIEARLPDNCLSIWNDYHGRTREDVVQLFNRAILSLYPQ